MMITPIKSVRALNMPFKNTCLRLSEWISPYTAIFKTSQGNRRVGFLLTSQIIIANCKDEVIRVKFKEFGLLKGILFQCIPDTNLSFYYFVGDIKHHGFRHRRRNIKDRTYLFGYVPYDKPVFYQFNPMEMKDSNMFQAFNEKDGLNLTCDSVAHSIPIFDMHGRLYGFSFGNYNDEHAVMSMVEIAKSLKK